MKRTKRVVVLADMHCGHFAGLTPPSWHNKYGSSARSALHKSEKMRQRLWKFYYDELKRLRPIDWLVINGDCIDGTNRRSGGVELLTSDRHDQADMAIENIKCAKAANILMTYGTDYHTGEQEDFERYIASEVNAIKIGAHEWLKVNNIIFDFKHHVGSSSIPHGRHTAVSRERMWNVLWADHGESPKSDIIIRSHVHYHNYCGGSTWLAMTTPALQGLGSRYGTRRCSGTVDFGLLHFDVGKNDYSWESHIINLSNIIKPIEA